MPYVNKLTNKKIIQELLDLGLINQDQLMILETEIQITGESVEDLLVTLGFVTENTLTAILAETRSAQRVSLQDINLDSSLIKQLPYQVLIKNLVIPITYQAPDLYLGMVNIDDINAKREVSNYFNKPTQIIPLIVAKADLLEAIENTYKPNINWGEIIQEFSKQKDTTDISNKLNTQLIDLVIDDAVKNRSSDIHFEPEKFFTRVRYRVDGKLRLIFSLHKKFWPEVCNRIKVIANLDIAESRKPQDGRFTQTIAGRNIDFRVAVHPTLYGENIVIRVLDKKNSLISLSRLGYSNIIIEELRQTMQKQHGIVIITGPTGSGKTTSLYSILNDLNTENVNIMTLEEPVEYDINHIRQSNVGPNLNFANGLRSILRQDPDIILVGEIRDLETASMALRASMTGHQIYTTLHTGSSIGALSRLIDLGISPGLLAGNILCILAQKLVRKLCNKCKSRTIKESDILICQPKGCAACNFTGYKGRTVVGEILTFDNQLDMLLASHATLEEIVKSPKVRNLATIAENAKHKYHKGIICKEELDTLSDERMMQ